MNHGSIVSVRALLAAALVMLAALLMPRTAAAQPGTVFDVKAVSAGEGQYGEFPLNFSVEYDNGIQQNIVIGQPCALLSFIAPANANNVVAIWFGGIRYVVQSHVVLCLPRINGGCWCLCLQWTGFFPLPRPRLFWYYNPCC